MNPVKINGKWHIEVYTKEFGNILLLDKKEELKPMEFNSEQEANDHINTINSQS